MSLFAQAVSIELRDRIAIHVDRGLAQPSSYPPRALPDERAVLVYATDALFAYYLGEDGAAYEIDMDTSRGAEVITSARGIRDVYERAVAAWPELAALLDIEIVERVDPQVGLLEGFEDGVGLWDEKAESREVAIRRCAEYFARRILAPGPAYVLQRLPSPPRTTFLTLQLAGSGSELDLELHVAREGGKETVELLHRGTREAIAARLRASDFVDTVLALERS